jgi:lipooligosaccharide transport system ATP-binding protein
MRAPAREAVVLARGLTKRYGPIEAVRGIDFQVGRQECVGLLGANGAGKSTTMRMLYGRTEPTAGQLEVLGLVLPQQAPLVRMLIGVVPQDDYLDNQLTVRENLEMTAAYFGLPDTDGRRRASELLELVQLSGRANDRPDKLSGGMRRRLALARGLINQPELVILDEPTTGLDPQARLVVWERLQALREQGSTLLMSTHYMEEASRLCDRVLIMSEGRIIADGTPADLIREHAGSDVLEVPPSEALERALRDLGELVSRRELHAGLVQLFTPDTGRLLEALVERGVPTRPHVARPASLEDVYLHLTGRQLVE